MSNRLKMVELISKLSADEKELLAALARIREEARAVGRETKNASNVGSTGLDEMAKKADKVGKGMAGILNGIYALEAKGSARVLALGNSISSLAGLLGPHGKLVQGVGVASTALVALFLQAKEASETAAKDMEADIKRLINAADLKGLDKLREQIVEGTIAEDGRDGLKAMKARRDALVEEKKALEANTQARKKNAQVYTMSKVGEFVSPEYLNSLQKINREIKALDTGVSETEGFLKMLDEGRGRAAKVNTDAADELARAAARAKSAIETLVGSMQNMLGTMENESAISKMRRKLGEFIADLEKNGIPIRKLQEELAELYVVAAGNGPEAMRAAQRIDAITARYGEQLGLITSLTEAAEIKDGEAAQERLRHAARAIEDITKVQGTRLAVESEVAAAATERAIERKREIADLEAEKAALAAGKKAYEDYERARSAEEAVRAAQSGLKAGQSLSQDEVAAIRMTATRAHDLQKSISEAREDLAAMSADTTDHLSAAFAEMAQSALSIATALGDAGENIARTAAVALPMFQGIKAINESIVKKDRFGRTITDDRGNAQRGNMLDALRGDHGAGQQAKALAGSLSIVGAIATVADALDVFGTKARERARAMQEAAQQFRIALEDFVAQAMPSSQSSALRQLRQQAGDLAKQAGAAIGENNLSFKVDITPESLRLAASFSDELTKMDPKYAALAARLRETADALDGAEEALRRQLQVHIEDQAVLRLQAAGLNEAAELRQRQLALERAQLDLTNARTDADKQYYAALLDTMKAQLEATRIMQAQAKARRELDNDNTFLGGSNADRIQRTLDSLKSLFPALADLDIGDLTSEGGLTAFKDQILALYAAMRADGLSEDEMPFIEALRQLLDLVVAGIGELPDAVDPIARALEVFGIRVAAFGLTAAEQLDQLLSIFASFDDELGGILSNVDTGSREELDTFVARLREQIAKIIEDGEVSEAEAPLLAALQKLLAAALDGIKEIDDAAEAEVARLARERQERVSSARTRLAQELSIFGIEGADAARRRLGNSASLSPIFGNISTNWSSSSGIKQTQSELQSLFRAIQAGQIPLSQFGDLTEDEVIEAIAALNSDLAKLAATLEDTSKAAAEAAAQELRDSESLRIRQLRASGEDTRIAEFDKAAKEELEAAAERSQQYRDLLAQTLAAERAALLDSLTQESADSTAAAESKARERKARNQQATSSQIGGITDATGLTLAGILRSISANTARDAAASEALVALLDSFPPRGATMPVPQIPPGLMRGAMGGGDLEIRIEQLTINAPPITLPPGTAITPALAQQFGMQLSQAAARSLAEALGKIVNADVRALGGRKA